MLRPVPALPIERPPTVEGQVTRSWDPGLAVDRSSGRAFVVQARAPVAEVDLLTFNVRSHPLQPLAGTADAVAGPTRHALWLRDRAGHKYELANDPPSGGRL
jgi:hypothetical protein